jgi:hypothetical protein
MLGAEIHTNASGGTSIMTLGSDLEQWEDEFYAAVREYLQTLHEKTQMIQELLAAKPPSAHEPAPGFGDENPAQRATTVRRRTIGPGIYNSAES